MGFAFFCFNFLNGYNVTVKNKKYLLISIAFVFALMLISQAVYATGNQAEGSGYYDLPLCMPGYYPNDPGDCLPFGPSETISGLREQGFPYPLTGLPANQPDPALSALPIRIASINDGQTKVYASLNDALGGGTVIRSYPGGLRRYVAFVEQANSGGTTYVRLLGGGWIEAEPLYSIPAWQGLEFFDSPESNFGWTIDGTGSYNGASFASGASGQAYNKYEAFPIYNMVEAEGYEWYQISPTEWMPSLKSRRVVVDTTTPPGVEGDRWINIDLHNQTLSAYENNQLVFAAVVATGSGELYSDPGTYRIYEKIEVDQMQGSYASDRSDFFYFEGVPWAMYYNHAQAIHGIYWPAALGFKQSHGCINMFPGDAHWLFNWAELGEYVYVHDPSGLTPIPTPTPVGTPGQEIIYPTATPTP